MNHLKDWGIFYIGVFIICFVCLRAARWVYEKDNQYSIKQCKDRGDIMGLYTEYRPELRECFVIYKGRKMPLDWLKNKWNY